MEKLTIKNGWAKINIVTGFMLLGKGAVMGNIIFETQNRIVALTVQAEFDRVRKWRGETKPAPRVRVDLTPKTELSPGYYVLNRDETLTHYLEPATARLFFHDLAERQLFNERYRTIFEHDRGRQMPGQVGLEWKAERLTATARLHGQGGKKHIALEIWDGPGRYDRFLDYVYPLDKTRHVLAIMLQPDAARSLGLAGLEAIQIWNTVSTMEVRGLVVGQAEQLSLAL